MNPIIKLSIIQVSCFFTLNAISQDTFNYNTDPTNNTINQNKLYLAEGQLGKLILTYDDYPIYEASANQNIKNQRSSGLGDKPWKYVVFPKLNIAKVYPPDQLDSDVVVDIDIRVTYPDRENLAAFLENSTEDNHINETDIDFLRAYGYFIHERGSVLKKWLAMTPLTPNKNLHASLTYPDMNSAIASYNRLLNGRSLDLSLIMNKRELKGGCDFSILSKDILESDAFRDFVSPVFGDTITADQAAMITNELVKDVSTIVQCKGDVSVMIEDLKSRVFDALFSERRVIPFDELAAKGYLIDFNNKRYSPSEFTHFLKNISNENYNHNLDSSYNKKRYVYDKEKNTLVDTDIDGKVFFGLIKGKVKNKVDSKRKIKRDELDEKSIKKINTQHSNNTLNLEFDGSVIIPRSIVTHEIISSTNSFIDRFDGSFEEHKQAFQLMTIQISSQ